MSKIALAALAALCACSGGGSGSAHVQQDPPPPPPPIFTTADIEGHWEGTLIDTHYEPPAERRLTIDFVAIDAENFDSVWQLDGVPGYEPAVERRPSGHLIPDYSPLMAFFTLPDGEGGTFGIGGGSRTQGIISGNMRELTRNEFMEWTVHLVQD